MSTAAADWSTFHCEHSSFVYGVASIRFSGVTVAIASALKPRRSHAISLAAATRRKAGPELRDVHSLLVRRAARGVRDRALDDRVLVRGHRQVPLDLGAGEDLPDRLQLLVRFAGRRIGVVELDSGPGREHRALLGLRATDEHDIRVARRDRLGRPGQQGLLEHPDAAHDAARAAGTEPCRHHPAGVTVRPDPARHEHEVRPRRARRTRRSPRRLARPPGP